MTTEELLVPRIKCFAPFPGMVREGWSLNLVTTERLTSEELALPTLYPHLFKHLEWHEERKQKEMPEYIYWIHSDKIHKVFQWLKNSTGHWVCSLEGQGYLFIKDIKIRSKEEFQLQNLKDSM